MSSHINNNSSQNFFQQNSLFRPESNRRSASNRNAGRSSSFSFSNANGFNSGGGNRQLNNLILQLLVLLIRQLSGRTGNSGGHRDSAPAPTATRTSSLASRVGNSTNNKDLQNGVPEVSNEVSKKGVADVTVQNKVDNRQNEVSQKNDSNLFRDTQATQLAPPAIPTQLAPPAIPTQLAPPTTPTQLAPPAIPTQLAPPVTPTQLAPPATPTQLAPPATPTQLAPPATPTQLAPPAIPTQLAPPATPTQLAPPAIPTQLAPPATPTQLAPPAIPTQLAPPTTPTPLAPQASATQTDLQPSTTQQPNSPEQKVIDVYLLGGQSNAVGLGGKRLEAALEKTLGADTESHQTNVFISAKGGTNLHTQWKADGTNNSTGDGVLYKTFQTKLDQYLTKLKANNPNAKINIAGMFWHQGESDAFSSKANQDKYHDNLTRFIKDVRATTGVADMPFMIGRLSDNSGIKAAPLGTIQRAQDNVATVDRNVVSVNMDDAQTDGGVHFTKTGYDKMADLFAKAYNSSFNV